MSTFQPKKWLVCHARNKVYGRIIEADDEKVVWQSLSYVARIESSRDHIKDGGISAVDDIPEAYTVDGSLRFYASSLPPSAEEPLNYPSATVEVNETTYSVPAAAESTPATNSIPMGALQDLMGQTAGEFFAALSPEDMAAWQALSGGREMKKGRGSSWVWEGDPAPIVKRLREIDSKACYKAVKALEKA